MDTRDIVAATLAGAVLQTLVPAGGGGVSDTVAEAADTQEATIQLAVLRIRRFCRRCRQRRRKSLDKHSALPHSCSGFHPALRSLPRCR